VRTGVDKVCGMVLNRGMTTTPTHIIFTGDHVTIASGKYAGCHAVVDETVGTRSLYVFIVNTEDHGQDDPRVGDYATIRRSSVSDFKMTGEFPNV
jgi:hypothetical protein